jgi:lipoate synthase
VLAHNLEAVRKTFFLKRKRFQLFEAITLLGIGKKFFAAANCRSGT